MAPTTKAAQRQFLVTMTPVAAPDGKLGPTISGYFANKSGGEMEATISKVFDGGSLTPSVLPGVATVGDLTISRPYDPTVDQTQLAQLRQYVGRLYYNISVQPTDVDFNVLGTPDVYFGILSKVTPPTVNAGSSDAAVVEYVFSISTVSP